MPSAFNVSASARRRAPSGSSSRIASATRPVSVEIAAQLRDDRRLGDAGLDRPLQRVDRAGRVAALPFDEREVAVGNRHVGPARDDALVDLHRVAEPPRAERLDGVVHGAIEIDELLRIVGLGVARLRRRAARHVAQRAQPRERRRDPPRGDRPASAALNPRRLAASARSRSGARPDRFTRSAGIGGKVVALRRSADRSSLSRSASTPDSGAQPRLSIAPIASKYDVRGAAPARRSAAGSSDRPGRSAGDACPTASRIVGRMSTCRAATGDTSPPAAFALWNAKPAKPAKNDLLCSLCALCGLAFQPPR